MTKRKTHAAIIDIPNRLLLELLDFEGGSIVRIQTPDDVFKPDTTEFVIEHPDLDLVESGFTSLYKFLKYPLADLLYTHIYNLLQIILTYMPS